LNSIILSEKRDQKIVNVEDRFRQILEQSLATFLERQVPVEVNGPNLFSYKEFKSAMPGEIVCVTLTATEGAPGRILIVMNKEAAGKLGDLLLMGDGNAAFSHDEHLEPVRDFCKEIISNFSSNISEEIGRRVAFEDVKTTLVDINMSDFVGTGWVYCQYELSLDAPYIIGKIVSQDFFDACYPDTDYHADSPTAHVADEAEDQEAMREIGMVMDIELPIAIELGRTSMLIRDIVRLAPGSVVELDKLSGEPVDLMVNGKIFAKGEVVVVDENFAVRITELTPNKESTRGRRN
jgi:flagellar motor switch protein FliN